ncbi:response regulator receiver domain [Agrobacterium sp. 16-2014-1-2a]
MDTFDDFRLEATRQFAHTLIVVDDEASTEMLETAGPAAALKKPGRIDLTKALPAASAAQSPSHPLKADVLVETSMSLGLICSVLKPKPEDGSVARVAKAAEKADILCVDWEMHRDEGKTALEIIGEVVARDETIGGRFRLIAIYTGVSDKAKILNKVLEHLPKATVDRRGIVIKENFLASTDGLRIVWLLKKGGTYPKTLAAFAADESELPARLQKEFSYLSGGVLTNVAIATIASIRSATHHVISKFSRDMDGPYFHHRSTVQSAEDAEEYATQIILSELKNAIDSSSIAAQFAGRDALDKAITSVLPEEGVSIGLGPKALSVSVDQYKDLIIDGIGPTIRKFNDANASLGRKESFFQEFLADPFSDSKASRRDMLKFAALTCLAADAVSGYRHHEPLLSLGSIIRDADGNYVLCVQASCDSVRLKKPQPFLFAQLEIVLEDAVWQTKEKIEFVVPHKPTAKDSREFLCLKLSDKAPYAALRSIVFAPTKDEKVTASRSPTGIMTFEASSMPAGKRSDKHKQYVWIADVKRRRALRTVQYIGQTMGRIGFDEFEAFRRKYG